jgi:DNA repair exonuclease SbcCD nuclease subunit
LISFLHTADWQIGRVYAQFEADDAAALFEARFNTVARLAALASEHAVDAVLVAGDVFDAQTVSDKTLHRLFNAMQGYAGPWLLLPGNHDAALAESVWTRIARMPELPANIQPCLQAQPLQVAGKFVLLPAPLTQRHTHHDLTDWFDHCSDASGLPRVGLAHGSVQGLLPDGIDSSNPIAAQRAQQAGLAYLALGDWHGCKQVDARTWYAGTPESDRFKANDSGQVLLVRLAADSTHPEVLPLRSGQYRWRLLEVQLDVESDVDTLLDNLASVGSADVLQLRLSGSCTLAGQRRLSAALARARASARALVCDDTGLRLTPSADDLQDLQADGYVGAVLQQLRAEQEGETAELANDALLELARILDAQAMPQGGPA